MVWLEESQELEVADVVLSKRKWGPQAPSSLFLSYFNGGDFTATVPGCYYPVGDPVNGGKNAARTRSSTRT